MPVLFVDMGEDLLRSIEVRLLLQAIHQVILLKVNNCSAGCRQRVVFITVVGESFLNESEDSAGESSACCFLWDKLQARFGLDVRQYLPFPLVELTGLLQNFKSLLR